MAGALPCSAASAQVMHFCRAEHAEVLPADDAAEIGNALQVLSFRFSHDANSSSCMATLSASC